MPKGKNTFYGIIGLIIGVITGVAGTAFSAGAERQRFADNIARNSSEIASIDQEMDNYSEAIASQIARLQVGIAGLTGAVSDLRTDVQVLKALMERVEKDLQIDH